ncbi:hypothetical protein QE375_001631 [Microbacterium foliorum]|uniref:HTH cro/C1-type domain-containing protein n=1 Tax=Microbacterium foliorum TaxID=104336 RepID=A0ABU1HQI1_9MICO|nr:hypothetical protein [Microbacterium foliorum]MDR6142077.1 hypothetical protein [Microbacterium foliorum]
MSEVELAERFADALVSEIKAEMGRQSLSSRAVGRLIGKSSQYMSDRLDGGNVKTGRRVLLNIWDLAAIAGALNLTEVELISRAEAVASGKVITGRFGVGSSREDLGEVAFESALPHEHDTDDLYDE